MEAFTEEKTSLGHQRGHRFIFLDTNMEEQSVGGRHVKSANRLYLPKALYC